MQEQIKIKARAVKDNKPMTIEEISVRLEQIQKDSDSLKNIAKKVNELENRLQTEI